MKNINDLLDENRSKEDSENQNENSENQNFDFKDQNDLGLGNKVGTGRDLSKENLEVEKKPETDFSLQKEKLEQKSEQQKESDKISVSENKTEKALESKME